MSSPLPLLLLLFLLSFCLFPDGVRAEDGGGIDGEGGEEAEPAVAVLFPSFSLTIGIVAFWMLSRFAPQLPYTAVMFLIGTFMGIGAASLDSGNLLHQSLVEFWINIDSEVLLLTFLPGLIFKDASSLDVHLFRVAFWQCFNFAFPMVLAGTALTALVAYYVFPYDWSFNLSMTFGSILSATDPVAVAALLDAVGAPTRLKLHIGGESLLNDGSAIVFFTIFSRRFFDEVGLPEGSNIGWAEGIKIFFRMSVGGACIGAFFAIGLLAMLHSLDKRLNSAENVTQVAASFTMAYLCYFTADTAWGTSGVIANLTLGLLTNAFGRAMLNDVKLLDNFWSLVEYLLNTVLFCLGGLVWGSIISNKASPDNPDREFTARDWGYLVVLYLFLTIIRFFLVAAFYPITVRIGLSSSWQEGVFEAFGGLRGAVGISLAIFLDNIVKKASDIDPIYEVQTNKLFGFVGGIAFMSLVINATTAGPLLRKLGLVDVPEIREKMLAAYSRHRRAQAITEMLRLLSQERFRRVNFAVIRHHVPLLSNLTKAELELAAQQYEHALGSLKEYRVPKLDHILPYMKDVAGVDQTSTPAATGMLPKEAMSPKVILLHKVSSMSRVELRLLFLELLKNTYEHQISYGELSGRDFLAFSLEMSLDIAADDAAKDLPLNDWEVFSRLDTSMSKGFRRLKHHPLLVRGLNCCHRGCAQVSVEYALMHFEVERCLSFIYAHQCVQAIIEREFLSETDFNEAEKEIIAESKAEVEKAKEKMRSFPEKDVEVIVSHKFCTILLNNSARFVEQLAERGLYKGQEADELLEIVQDSLAKINSCSAQDHPDELPMAGTVHDPNIGEALDDTEAQVVDDDL